MPAQQTTEQLIGEELLRIHVDSYGKGAAEAKVLLSEDAVVAFLDGLELQCSEEFLIEEGHANAVIETRSRFQQAIEATFRAAIERATGRRVVSFTSTMKLDPHYAVEVFRLAPRS